MRNWSKIMVLSILMASLLVTITGCGSALRERNNKKPPPKTKAVPLAEQVKATGHYRFFKDMIEQEKYPPERADSCIKCHSAVRIMDDPKAKFTDFQPGGKYEKALEGITCRVCHVMGGDNMFSLRTKGLDSCGECHTAEGITAGEEVHHPQLEMLKGVEGIGVEDKPSRKMNQKFTCYECHFTNQLDHDFKALTATGIASNERCSGCHNNSEKMEEQLKNLQNGIKARLETLKTRLEEAQNAVRKAKESGEDVTEAEKALGAALTNITFVDADKSLGIHNPEYSDSLLQAGAERLEEVGTLLGHE